MSHQYSTASKVGTLFWSLAIGAGIVALGTSILLPSTKSARVIHSREEVEPPATMPTTAPAESSQEQLMPGSKSAPVFNPHK